MKQSLHQRPVDRQLLGTGEQLTVAFAES